MFCRLLHWKDNCSSRRRRQAEGWSKHEILCLGFFLWNLQWEHPRPPGGDAQRGAEEDSAASVAGHQGERLHQRFSSETFQCLSAWNLILNFKEEKECFCHFYSDLRWVQVDTAEEAYKVVKLGKKNQSFCSTRLNNLSSRRWGVQ